MTATFSHNVICPEKVYRIGIDAGSKTVKLVVLDDHGAVLYSAYRRHGSNIRETLRALIHDLHWMRGNFKASMAATGSAGISVARLLGIPFIQEVMATTDAVRRDIPDADVVIELGGEDAKVVYLTGGIEQRMNATCAGGTGGFIDTIAYMLGVRTKDMSSLAMGSQRTYPIASRCAVFAQMDVRPLLNEGASRADIAASALDAVVRQTLGGLACGRPITGKVVFLGGPFEYIPDLVHRFRKALGLGRDDGIKPSDAHLFPAWGAALSLDVAGRSVALDASETDAQQGNDSLWELGRLEEFLADPCSALDATGLARLDPLFTDPSQLKAFRERHSQAKYPVKRSFDAEGPLYLGIDAGSTTVKLALLDEEGNLLHNDYQPNRGDIVETVRDMLITMYQRIPTSVMRGHEPPYIAHATATGYGETLLMEGFGVDSGIVETTAHARAARQFCPDATFVLDIGGQDMKALWIKGEDVNDAVLNEACSSGCGAFLSGTAYSLHANSENFAAEALKAESPVDLGMRCTVFMSSRVKHAQKAGASVADIAAGAAYSVVHNALFRIIGPERVAAMGNRVVVQGGAFMSDAVLRAFELTCGMEVVRPDRAHIMGAIGAALTARSRAREKRRGGDEPVSVMVGKEALESIKPKRSRSCCDGCANECKLSILDFGNGRRVVSGNRCERGKSLAGGSGSSKEKRLLKGLNLVEEEQRLLRAFTSEAMAGEGTAADELLRRNLAVGVVDGLGSYRHSPFWCRLLSALGFRVLLPEQELSPALLAKAWETVPAESLCYPAKLVHAKAFALRDKGADALVFPQAQRGRRCAVSCTYGDALLDSVGWLRDGSVGLASPQLSSLSVEAICQNKDDLQQLEDEMAGLCRKIGVPLEADEFQQSLQCALKAQRAFETALAAKADEMLAYLAAHPDAHGIVLAGRPYHGEPAVLHGIDRMLASMGFAVFGDASLAHLLEKPACRAEGLPEWKPARHLMKVANFVAEHSRLDLVCLQFFGCGYDAMSLEEVRTALEEAGKPFTALKLDEMAEGAHVLIRLRTLAESIESRKRSEAGGASEGRKAAVLREAKKSEAASTMVASASEDDVSSTKQREAVRLLDCPLDEHDLAVARASTVKDVCFSANVLAARAIRLLREDPAISALMVPEVCHDCLNETIPRAVERATGKAPRIIWERSLGSASGCPSESGVGEGSQELFADGCPAIGVIGNPLLVFDPFMNEGIVKLIESLGCRVVLPDEQALYVDEVRYLDQLEAFAQAGVRHVIYLQSFGCVKGHVNARGSHYLFQERFPAMPVTVLDYDPESSALNRENRIRLIVESVLRDSGLGA